MPDEQTDADDGASSIGRRTVLRSAAIGAAGLGGFVGVGAAGSEGPDVENVVRTHGDLEPAEAIDRLRQVESFGGFASPDDPCYTDSKCVGGCGTQGAVAYRECCPELGGCTDWTETGICC